MTVIMPPVVVGADGTMTGGRVGDEVNVAFSVGVCNVGDSVSSDANSVGFPEEGNMGFLVGMGELRFVGDWVGEARVGDMFGKSVLVGTEGEAVGDWVG